MTQLVMEEKQLDLIKSGRFIGKMLLEFDPTIGGKYEDCFDRQYSERVVVAYMKRYATEKRLGRTPRYEDMG